MRILSVDYALFEHEASGPWSTDDCGWHQIDGELRFELEGGECVFLSWGSSPATYCIQMQPASFFNNGVLATRQMSEHPYWTPFINKECHLRYQSDDNQVLAFSTEARILYLSSQYDDGDFYGDCVRISPTPPDE